MAITRAERLARRLGHAKQERIVVKDGVPAVSDMWEGVPELRKTREGVVEYVKKSNVLYKKVLDKA